MEDIRAYLIHKYFKTLVFDMVAVYNNEDDIPLSVLNTTLQDKDFFHENKDEILIFITDFLKFNKDAIENHGCIQGKIAFFKECYLDLQKYLDLKDENSSIIYQHLKNILHIYNDGSILELTLFNEMLEKLALETPNIIKHIEEQSSESEIKLETSQDLKNILQSKDLLKHGMLLAEKLKPRLELEHQILKDQDIDHDIFFKVFCFKMRDYFYKNRDHLPTNKEDEILDIINYLVQTELSEFKNLDPKFILKVKNLVECYNIPVFQMLNTKV